ncbi:Crp/Fnr family transcriptional regulator [Tabrizicola sp.]|uniref:Crp/Fnr family transcriptional regulator n=1 Tax=Tabrizicola sp. TaxID=2005166 RepID=UPI002733C99F|nr:Crp/Fnr family transcriptional regulator [Tabrizicola sp.]MDP3194638.1 Crp/Fnr family transcriptional regulator [Tabrizicola sp.]
MGTGGNSLSAEARPGGPLPGLPSRLQSFPIFSALSAESLAELAQGMREQHWGPGQLIFSRGDAGDHMLAILAGRVRLVLSSARGREIVLRTLGPSDILGEMALIDGEPRSADATAAEATTCLVLPRARFEAVAERRPDIGMAMARHLSSHLRRTNFQMESIALYDLQTRLVRFLLHSLAHTPDTGQGNQRRLTLGVNQTDVSAILGASRPKISQAFQALIAVGAIRRDGDAYLCDVAALTDLCEGPAD